MNPDKQRIAIAEACGWKIIHDSKRPVGGVAHQIPPGRDISWFISVGEPLIDLPDYLNDLNAMHAAEGALAEKDRIEYGNQLIAVCDRDMNKPGKRWAATTFYIIHATAAQRAESFLRTIGRWEDK